MSSSRRRPRSNSSGPERRSSRTIPLRRSVTYGSGHLPTLYVVGNAQVFTPSPLREETKRVSVQPYPDFVKQANEYGFYTDVDPNSITPRFPGVQPQKHTLPAYRQDEIDSGGEELSEVDIDESSHSKGGGPKRHSRQANSSLYTDSPSKFTNKWPALRGLDNSVKSAGSRVLYSEGDTPPPPAPSLEEGRRRINPYFGSEKWTVHKWVLMITIFTVLLYALAGLGYAVTTWYNAWDKAVVMTVADMDILTVITLTASLMLFTSLVGITGALLDSRPILAVYALLMWPCLICLLAVGYTSYKRATFSLDHKLNLSWSRYYTRAGRLAVQDSLGCCGFYGPLHDSTPSVRCYLRTPLPGCKAMLYDFESRNLRFIWQGAFALVPVHLVNVIAALLCANHITDVFGKGMTPKQYRLSALDVKEDAHRILGSFNGKNIEEIGYAKIPAS